MRALARPLLLAPLLGLLTACGGAAVNGNGAPATDTTLPTVAAVSPANGATSVAPGTTVVATFSEAMMASSVDAASFTLVDGSTQALVSGTVTLDGSTATFTPASPLPGGRQFTATITNAVKDAAGNALAVDFTWSFTTVLDMPVDTTPPTVSSTTPSAEATGVAVNSTPSATFSEAMTNATLSTASFTVRNDALGTQVSGAVTVSGNTAIFTPAAPLADATHFTALITTAARDAAGNALAADVSWSFTTEAATPVDTTPPSVVSTTPGPGASGVQTGAAVAVSFSELMSNTSLNTSSFTLVNTASGAGIAGTVAVSGTAATFTPSAPLAAGVQYTATITTGAKDAAGNPLVSDYTWHFTTLASTPVDTTPPTVSSTVPVANATGVASNASISATFSEAMNNSTLNASSVTLAKSGNGSAVGASIAVSGNSVTLKPGAALSASTQYTATITTAAKDAAGNALAANYTWKFTTAAAPDNTPPTVSTTTPANGATAISLAAVVKATFSEAMSNSSLNSSSFTLVKTSGGAAVAGSVSISGTTATFTPAAALAASTQYTATVTTAAKDAAGNPLAANVTWGFTTGSAPDTTPPTVSATSPANGASAVPPSSAVTATFSEAMSNSTLTTSSFTVAKTSGGAAVSGSVSVSGTTATFTPTSALTAGTQYTGTITTAAKDVAGNALAANHTWTFTTAAAPDTTPPTVNSTVPAAGAVAVSSGIAVSATFSELMTNATLSTASFTLTDVGLGTSVGGTVGVSSKTATFTPSAALADGTQYRATLTTAVKDLAGNSLASTYSWTFTTSSASAPSLGAHSLAYVRLGGSSAQVSTASMTTQSAGGVVLASVGRGNILNHVAPTDNKGNSFVQLGSAHAYLPAYPNSGTALYAVQSASGGAGHVVRVANADPSDEVTLAVVEVKNGGSISYKWNEVLAGDALTSQSITTTGPATLVAFWWGDADGSVAHTAVANNGFTVIDSVLAAGSLVQCAVAVKSVAAAGTYNVTWTATPTQGAQLWLVAVQ